MRTDNLGERALAAIVSGLVAGVVTALVVWLISVLVPGVALDPGFWGTVVGVIVGLFTFFSGRNRVL
jgi:VIT1/CCC1 family predicted Fe2+/Mn2+ transporter